MTRTARTWLIFSAALALVLTVMLFFTARMLQFERAVAAAEARAVVEENIRLALWRMDTAAGALLAPPQRPRSFNSVASNDQALQNNSFQQRADPRVQTQLSMQEYEQRAAYSAPVAQRNWRQIEPTLLARISDILPGASLAPVAGAEAGTEPTRRLASIPARLVIPPASFDPPLLPWNTPLRVSLMIAWVGAAVAATAVALLLRAALVLSERRGAFVSAVTHELRTPLTTFKMYSEMLAGGMVSDPSARQQYLDTLVSESDRLGHLIENVLSYARLERQLSPRQAQVVALSELLDRSLPGLQRRAQQAGLALNVAAPDEAAAVICRTDTIAVQQILLNLIDNACKYGRSDIDLAVETAGAKVIFRVSDRGPGVDPGAAARLFRAFSKSRGDAIPGIGLGLFLSRRLARDLGGDLAYVASTPGAQFVFTLPLQRN